MYFQIIQMYMKCWLCVTAHQNCCKHWNFFKIICVSDIYIQYCAKVMQTPVDEIRRNSWLFDEFLTETKLRRHFCEFSRHVLFWTARTFGDKFLDGVNATRNFERKFVLCGEFSGQKFVVLFILLKRIWLNLWLVTTLCNTSLNKEIVALKTSWI